MQSELIVSTKKDLESLIRQCIKDELSVISNLPKEAVPKLPEILNIKQASEFLNLATPTIYAFTSQRKIPFFKTGKKLYFKRSELLEWIENGKQEIIPKVTKKSRKQ